MGWEPATVTTHTYEGGLLARSVTVSEPEWSPDDLLLLRGYLQDERVVRGSHGHPLAEAMSSDADPSRWDAAYKYVVPPPSMDFARKAIDDAKEAMRVKYPDANLGSMLWRAEKVANPSAKRSA